MHIVTHKVHTVTHKVRTVTHKVQESSWWQKESYWRGAGAPPNKGLHHKAAVGKYLNGRSRGFCRKLFEQ